jgi:DNA-binding PadR family transcriptional regulator
MLEAEWIERYEAEDTSRDKQTYRINPAGRERLIGDLNRMRALTRSAASRLKMGGR